MKKSISKMSKAEAQKLDIKLDKKLGEKEQLRDAAKIKDKRAKAKKKQMTPEKVKQLIESYNHSFLRKLSKAYPTIEDIQCHALKDSNLGSRAERWICICPNGQASRKADNKLNLPNSQNLKTTFFDQSV